MRLKRLSSKIPAFETQRGRGVFHRFLIDCDGSMTVWNLFWVVLLLGIGGISVDYTSTIRMHAQLQATADAASLAAAMDLPDKAKAIATAQTYAARNSPGAAMGEVTLATDVRVGFYNPTSKVFSANISPFNAVEVRSQRVASRANALRTFLLRFLGVDALDVAATSMTMIRPSNCAQGGFFTIDRIETGSNNDIIDGFCLHGDDGVKISSDNSFEAGTTISMENLSTFMQSGGNTGVAEALKVGTASLTMPARVQSIADSMQTGSFTGLPSYITQVSYVSEITSSTPIVPGTLYVVSGVADFGSDRNLSNIAVVAQLEVKTGSNVTMRNTFFVSESSILMGSNNTFGTAGVCTSGTYSVYLLALNNIEFGSQSLYQGMMMASRMEIKMGSQSRGVQGVFGEANGMISVQSNDTLGGCPDGLISTLAGAAASARAVAMIH